jgi:hypothetical protein
MAKQSATERVREELGDQRLTELAQQVDIGEHLKLVVQEVVESSLGANAIQEVFGAAGIILHPGNVQNLLERRYAQRAQRG